MLNSVRNRLIEVARERSEKTITYQALCNDCKLGLDMSFESDVMKLSKFLDEIADFEYYHKRPALTCLVVRSDTGQVGNGFYTLFERLEGKDWKQLKRDDQFWGNHFFACREFWREENNFLSFKKTDAL